jgi:hypothetical protein
MRKQKDCTEDRIWSKSRSHFDARHYIIYCIVRITQRRIHVYTYNTILQRVRVITAPTTMQAVSWLRRLAAGLPPRKPGFNPGSVHVGFVVDKVALGQVFPEFFSFPLSISFHRCSITRKRTKNNNHPLHLHNRVAQ